MTQQSVRWCPVLGPVASQEPALSRGAEIRSPADTQPARLRRVGLDPRRTQVSHRALQISARRTVGDSPRKNRAQSRRSKVFVDFQNDVTTDDLALAHEEGYESLEHLKRYTTLGMGTDQGKTSNIAAAHLMAGLAQHRPPDRRHHDISPTLHTALGRRDRRPAYRRTLPPDTPNADA